MTSLITAGLALPPVTFINWPTHQPKALGLVSASSTLSGLAAIKASTVASIRPVSVSCFKPSRSTMMEGASPVSIIRANTSFAILPFMVPLLINSTNSPKRSAVTGLWARSLSCLLSQPNNSTVIQLFTSLASRPLAAVSKKSAASLSATNTAAS